MLWSFYVNVRLSEEEEEEGELEGLRGFVCGVFWGVDNPRRFSGVEWSGLVQGCTVL